MKLSELKAMNSSTPSLYAGRKYIKRCGYRREFEIDAEIIDILTVKMITDENGNEAPMRSPKTGEILYDHRIFIPFKGRDGQQYLTQTKSPLIRSLIRKLPVTKTEEVDGETWNYHEPIEGLLVFGEGDYKYGENTVPVTTLEEAEE